MHRSKFFIVTFLVLCFTSASAQIVKVRFVVTPAKEAHLFLDGEDKGIAHGQKLTLGFNKRKGITSYKVEVKSKGYETQSYTIDTDSPRSQTIKCSLERTFDRIENAPNLIFDVEKIVSGIEYGSDVGANTRWKYKYNETINVNSKASKFVDALDKAGLNTLKNSSDDLFDVGNIKPKTPDIIIAGRVESFELKRTSGNTYSGSYVSKTSVNWQVYDRHKKEIILKVVNTTDYQFESNLISEQFFEAVIVNFYSFIGEAEDFRNAVSKINDEDYKNLSLSDSIDVDEVYSDVETISIPRVRLEETESFSDLVEIAMQASVTVLIDQDKGHGSGVVVSNNGYIVTNHHVTDGAKLIDVQFRTGMSLPADLIASSEEHDLSLIKVRAGGLTALPIIADSDNAREGDEVFVIGAPGDKELGQSVSKGIISAKRNIDGVRVIQTDTKISPGNSGSPLINSEGEIIGIINMKMIGEGVEGLSFAIDSRYLTSVLGLEYE